MTEPSPDTVFVKTGKGIEEIRSRTVKLPRDQGLVFLSIDGKSSVAELLPRSGMPAAQFHRTLEMLVSDGYIEAAAGRPTTFDSFADDGAEPGDAASFPKVETFRAASMFRQTPALDIDVEARARELKARAEAERRAREEAEARSRDSVEFDIPVAVEHTARAPQAPPTPAADESTKDRPDTARAPYPEPEPLRVQSDGPSRERLSIDRTAYDVLAEAAEARRVSQSAVRAPVRVAHGHDHGEHAAAARRARRGTRFGIVAVILIVVLPLIGVLWLQFIPLTRYVPDVQQALSGHLNQPVKLAAVRYVLLPTPRVILQGVVIGRDAGVRVDRIEAHASPFALFAQPKRFQTIDVTNAVITPAMLATLPAWLGGRSASDVRISSLQLTNVLIDVPGGAIAPFNGEVSFEPDGSVEQAMLANDNLEIRLSPDARGAALKVDATAWTIPFGPPVQFSHFTAAGRLTERELAIEEFNGRVAGGYLQANGRLSWPGPFVVHGSFALQNVQLDELLPSLTQHLSVKGVLEANGRYEMRADSADALLASTRLDGDFRISRGELENLDLLRGFHAPGASASRGGRTPFEKLTGTLHLSPAGYRYRQVRLSSGPFNATGAFEVAANGKLSGRVNAELVVGTHLAARSSFEVGGTVSEPVLRR